MIACHECRLELGGYVLDGLETIEREQVESHTSSCARCRAELEELTTTAELLAVLRPPTPPAPADLEHRVLVAGRRSAARRPAWFVAAALFVAALAGLAGGIALDRPPAPDTVLALRGADPVEVTGEAGLRQTPSGVQLDLVLDRSAPADQGYYHAWLQRGDRRVSAGTFVGTGQATRVQLLCGGRLDDYDRLTVTWHPFGEPDEVIALDAAIL